MSDKLSQITQRLNGGKVQEALKVALSNPPFDAAPAAKQADVAAVVQVLAQFKDAQMTDAVKDISDDEVDILMKYLFKGMESGQNSAQLFKWFAAVQARSETLGAITRVLVDKQRL